jgi:ribosome-associated protein
MDDTQRLIRIAYDAVDNKKARDIKILDLKDISPITDYFVICSGSSTTQVKAIADEVEEKLAKEGAYLHHKEGYSSGRWVLLDLGNIIVHVFHTEDREFYSIERLWADADVINY